MASPKATPQTKTLGGHVRKAREDAQLSREDVARKMGVSEGWVDHIEQGRCTVSAQLKALYALGMNSAQALALVAAK